MQEMGDEDAVFVLGIGGDAAGAGGWRVLVDVWDMFGRWRGLLRARGEVARRRPIAQFIFFLIWILLLLAGAVGGWDGGCGRDVSAAGRGGGQGLSGGMCLTLLWTYENSYLSAV